MAYYVGVSALKSLLRETGLSSFVLQLVSYLQHDFAAWDTFEKSPRLASHSNVGVIELMPTANNALYSFKYVNGHPVNTQKGLLTVTAFGALADVETGYPLLLSEMTVLTALRTAATSALAAKYMARSNSTTHAIIGCGAQSEFQALAFKATLGLNTVQVFDVDEAAMQKCAANLAPHGIQVKKCNSIAEAIQGADVITTATAAKTRATLLTADMVPNGVHLNAIGGDCPGKTELHPNLLAKCTIVVEFEPQSRIEGEVQQNDGLRVTQLTDVVTGKYTPRTSETDITLFDSVGFALEDFSVLRLVYDLVKGKEAYQSDLIPHLQDPKNLFGIL